MYENDYKRIGAKIAYYRKLNALTQVNLADRIGITSGYLSQIERGVDTLGVPLSTYMRIADAMGISIQDLLKE